MKNQFHLQSGCKTLLAFLAFTLLFSVTASARKIYISKGSDNGVYINGAVNSYAPGDTFVLKASMSPFSYFSLENIHGTAGARIVVINEGGQTQISAMAARHCTFIKFTGTGSGDQYGFYMTSPNQTALGPAFTISGRSADVEVDHADINTHGYGFWVKEEASCIDSLQFPNWRINNITIHDNRITNTVQEGIYAGSTAPNGERSITCNGVTINPIPLRLGNVKIYNNIISHTGRGGIQLSSCDYGTNEIYNNTVSNCGYEYVANQGNGIIIGGYTSAYVHDNTVDNTFSTGIFSLGAGMVRIENNKVDHSGQLDGHLANGSSNIMIDNRLTNPTIYTTFTIKNNTLGANSDYNIRGYNSFNTFNTDNVICNNMTVTGANASINLPNTIAWTNCNGSTPTTSTGGTTGTTATSRIEAENFSSMIGVQTESTSDAGGGMDVGWQDDNDWMDYPVNISAAGTYTVNFRVATMFNGPQFQVRNSAGTALASVTVPNTGGFQTWQTISAQLTLPAGQQTLRIYTTKANGGWNINWLEIQGNTGTTSTNKLPVVSAGSALTITLPTNTVTLSGSATDADGTIASYKWTQVTGPSNAIFGSATTAVTTAGSLVQGTYTFRLTATDNSGGSASADVSVTVGSSTTTSTTSTRIEAENFTAMNGIKTENTSDAGGGLDVGWQDTGDWMDYSVNAPAAATYTLNFRVATMFTGPQFQVRNSSGTVLATVSVPNTGTFQTWQTVSANVTLPAGQQTLRIYTSNASGGWNLNWFEIQGSSTAAKTSNLHVEAESFSSMNGIQTENTSDAGGGLDVGWQDDNDWMDYPVNISTAGTYTAVFRVATMFTGPQFQVRNASGTVLATLTVPNTGGFQTWQTISAQLTLPAGQQTLRIVTSKANGGWNLNWFEIQGASSTISAAGTVDEITSASAIEVFPNPVTDRFALKVNNTLTGKMTVKVYDMSGVVKKTYSINKAAEGALQTYLSIGGLPKGEYLLKATMTNWEESTKLIKQ